METTPADVEVGACRYLLHMLLQRLEVSQPGLVDNMLQGAKADLADMNVRGVASPAAAEAVAMLEIVLANNQMAEADGGLRKLFTQGPSSG